MPLDGVWRVSRGCLEGVSMVSGAYLWHVQLVVRCLDVSEGQVRTCQVKPGQVKSGLVD